MDKNRSNYIVYAESTRSFITSDIHNSFEITAHIISYYQYDYRLHRPLVHNPIL